MDLGFTFSRIRQKGSYGKIYRENGKKLKYGFTTGSCAAAGGGASWLCFFQERKNGAGNQTALRRICGSSCRGYRNRKGQRILLCGKRRRRRSRCDSRRKDICKGYKKHGILRDFHTGIRVGAFGEEDCGGTARSIGSRAGRRAGAERASGHPDSFPVRNGRLTLLGGRGVGTVTAKRSAVRAGESLPSIRCRGR